MSFDFRHHTAVFGGTFNPPHVGHVEAVKGLFKNPGVAETLIVPSFGTPQKTSDTSFSSRFEMTRLAFPDLTVSRVEEELKTQYTWQLLEVLSHNASRLAFVIGTDQFTQIESWANFSNLMSMCDWIVLIRKPHQLDDFSATLKKYCGDGWLQATTNSHEFVIKNGNRQLLCVETEAADLSSTEIRKSFALGKIKEVSELLPKNVFEFIERNHLYGT